MDSDSFSRDEWRDIGGTVTSEMEHLNPEQTPENYMREITEWWTERKKNR